MKDWYNTNPRRLGPWTYLWIIAIQCKYSKTLCWEPIRKRFHSIRSSIWWRIRNKKWNNHQSIWRQPQVHRHRSKSVSQTNVECFTIFRVNFVKLSLDQWEWNIHFRQITQGQTSYPYLLLVISQRPFVTSRANQFHSIFNSNILSRKASPNFSSKICSLPSSPDGPRLPRFKISADQIIFRQILIWRKLSLAHIIQVLNN